MDLPSPTLRGISRLEGDSGRTGLALRTFSLEYVSPVGAVYIPAVRPQTFHAIRPLLMVCSGRTTMSAASLIVAIYVSDASCSAFATFEIRHRFFHLRANA